MYVCQSIFRYLLSSNVDSTGSYMYMYVATCTGISERPSVLDVHGFAPIILQQKTVRIVLVHTNYM
jgi:hypothetical protein